MYPPAQNVLEPIRYLCLGNPHMELDSMVYVIMSVEVLYCLLWVGK